MTGAAAFDPSEPASDTDRVLKGVSDDSKPVVRKGLAAIASFILIFIVGGSFAPLDAAVVGQGQVVVAGNRQSVQHRDGGIVSKLNVREGRRVRAGDVLLEVDATELSARERVLARQTMAFQMHQARLQAELDDRVVFESPEWIAQLGPNDLADAEGAYLAQKEEFTARAASLGVRNLVLAEKIAQLDASIEGLTGEIASIREQEILAKDQLADIRSLYDRGYSPLSRVRALESSVAELNGRLKSLQGQQNRDRREIAEFVQQRRELSASRRDSAAEQLREVQTELLTLEPQLQEVRAQLERAFVRATASGQVVGLSAFTEGGVIAPGQMLMEIVPENVPLMIEVRIRPEDVQSVHVGQKAQVKFSVAHARRIPPLFGSVRAVSADQLTDQQTSRPYFKVQVELSVEEMKRSQKAIGFDLEIRPGLPADVVIPTRGRTALGYLLDPISDALWRGLREE